MGSITHPEKMANLAIIDYEKLADKDAAEIQKLADAGQKAGMFYLDLRGPRTKAIFDDVDVLFKTGNEFFHLPQESAEKVQSLREGMERG